MRTINEIIVHCTATPAGRPVTVADINAWHLARGWSGIGYHRVVGLNGERWQGRALAQIGAHCEGRNSTTLGVVYVGGVLADGRTASDTRTPDQKAALLDEILSLRDRFNIRKISGHREYAAKACPSFDASAEYDTYFEGGSGIAGTVDQMLARGDAGPAVLAWADDLAAYRKLIGHQWPLRPTAVFDQDVEMVTRWFQKERGILVDGKVGPQTYMEMERALAGKAPFSALFD